MIRNSQLANKYPQNEIRLVDKQHPSFRGALDPKDSSFQPFVKQKTAHTSFAQRCCCMSQLGSLIVDQNGKLLGADELAEALFGFNDFNELEVSQIFDEDVTALYSESDHRRTLRVSMKGGVGQASVRSVPVKTQTGLCHVLDVHTIDSDDLSNSTQVAPSYDGDIPTRDLTCNPGSSGLADFSPYGLVLLSSNFDFVEANQSFFNITNLNPDEAAGRGWLSVLSLDESQDLAKSLVKIEWGSDSTVEMECLLISPLGNEHWVQISGRRVYTTDDDHGYVLTFEDIDQRKRANVEIQERASVDGLTGLPNRREFEFALTECIEESRTLRSILAVLFIDLDGFKEVNDSFGHNAGDKLLKKIAQTIETASSRATKVARLGGDEFTVLLTDVKRIEEVKHFASRLGILLQQEVKQGDLEISVSASIGIAMHHKLIDDRRSSDRIVNDLLRHADDAMYAAKHAGKNCYRFYGSYNDSDTRIRSLQSADKLLRDISQAIRRDELDVAYQPQVNTKSGIITSCEALLRWNHRVEGAIAPNSFVPLVESNGDMGELTIWLIKQICKDYKNTLDSYAYLDGINNHLTISVNLSPAQLQDQDILATIDDIIHAENISAKHFLFEITERTLVSDPAAGQKSINWLHEQGYRVALDDFGTGYSSLAYLHQFPLDEIKLDGSFILDVESSQASRTVVKSVVDMAHALELRVTAEGVELESHLHYLREIGCDNWQGFLMSPAVNAVEFITLVESSLYGNKHETSMQQSVG